MKEDLLMLMLNTHTHTHTHTHTTGELSIKFYLGQNSNYTPGDSISDISESVLKRKKSQYICDFGEGSVHAVKHVCFAEGFCWSLRVTASHQEQILP